MSRPRGSVPNQCAELGGASRFMTSCSSGGYGAITGASRAASTQKTMTRTATIVSGDCRSARGKASVTRERRASPVNTCTGARLRVAISVPHPDTRIEQPVGEVHREVYQHIDGRHHDTNAHDGREVKRGGAVEGVEAETWPGEDTLNDHRAREEPAKAQTDNRQGRDETVACRVQHQYCS